MDRWIVLFADTERGMAGFQDEVSAQDFFDRAKTAWTCWLFQMVGDGQTAPTFVKRENGRLQYNDKEPQ